MIAQYVEALEWIAGVEFTAVCRCWKRRPIEFTIFEDVRKRDLNEVAVLDTSQEYKPEFGTPADRILFVCQAREPARVATNRALTCTDLVAHTYCIADR
ncbi:hypothetical protein HPDFL43_01620 [Hoeflea phototrophica DFL-43]|jgi:hypothetical protein|uniref:Uncharacterized protein n=1 Tax=Hoeflea phototrophica (strain DSM 17068 / NCIMB 14078 / DFL-43) TaxID=411684 RepID=A9CZV4_HOEPD|nr:hypothetical protein HPDFL43_01620 [Hoeflea phototrophica DFL-43]